MDAKASNIPPELRREIEDFTAEVERRSRGEVAEEDFKRFRLQQGIYGQRQANDIQMVRSKLPQGKITSEKLDCLADFADAFSNGILHVTTRQDIQFHFVNLKNVPKGLQLLAESGITTREACGNTVRNVTACHKAGTCAQEAFDAAPYGAAVTSWLLRHPATQNMPRKFKITFGGCGGCGLAPINDIGCKAVVREEGGRPVRGFKVLIGGGLGSAPQSAQLLADFLPVGNLLRMCEAIIQVFNKHGNKKNRNKARFKFVLEKYGLEKVRELYQQEYAALEGKKFPEIQVAAESIPAIGAFTARREFDAQPDFIDWRERNTVPQRQAGFHNVQIKLLLGDIASAQARAISKVAADYAAGIIVTTVNQNLMVPWVKTEALGAFYGELKKTGLHKAGVEQLRDITCCPGSETCNLGITASRGLAAELSKDLDGEYAGLRELDDVSVKISGCPNSCGQHHIASIGFHGGAKKVNGILTPHYEMMLGGRVTEDEAIFGTVVTKIPSKNIPQALHLTLTSYRKEKQAGEAFHDFVGRKGRVYFANLLEHLRELPAFGENPALYFDYGGEQKFSLEDRGQGECAGAVTDMIQEHILDAERGLFQGRGALEKGDNAGAAVGANRAVLSAANGLLVTEGMDFSNDLEALKKFHSLIIDTGIVSEKFAGILQSYQDDPARASREIAVARLDEAGELIEECKRAYNKLQSDKSLRLRVGPDEKGAAEAVQGAAVKERVRLQMNLLGVKCPFNYVKTKLKLETMAPGQTLEVLLDDGEPAKNVPRSIQNDGHKVLALDKVESHFKLVIERV